MSADSGRWARRRLRPRPVAIYKCILNGWPPLRGSGKPRFRLRAIFLPVSFRRSRSWRRLRLLVAVVGAVLPSLRHLQRNRWWKQVTQTEEEPTVEEPKGPTPEEIERLRIATELNQFRYVGFMAVGGGSQKKKNMAVVVKNDEMHVVQVGEVIAGEVLVKAVSMSEITLQDVASRITQVIPVTDAPGAEGQPN
jgi:hypothetical protein